MTPSPETLAWLDAWTACINACDYEGGRALFAPDVVAFGTFADEMRGLDALVEGQWREIWPRTRGFAFDPDSLVETAGVDGSLVTVTGRWSSHGLREGAAGYPRHGRSTLILRRDPGGALRAVHSHLSMARGFAARDDRPPQPNLHA